MSNQVPHRRKNALTGDYVQVSPHRMSRPWQGEASKADSDPGLHHDPDCYLCPGNRRANGQDNPGYAGTFVFDNDFPALLDEAAGESEASHPLLEESPVRGTCRVICFSPEHNMTLARMDLAAVETVIATWQEQYTELQSRYEWVQVFENKGAMMGCSSPHPHGQIWALDALPTEAMREDQEQRRWLNQQGEPLLLDYAELELAAGERVVDSNEHWLTVVPFWAAWPFETLLLPRFPCETMVQLDARQVASLARILKRLLLRYDNLFHCDFPYSIGWHAAPRGAVGEGHWQLHAHFYPPLLRSAEVRKFMVGYELLAEAQRDLTPEQAADRLRAADPERHYRE